jgi:putative selenate reductase
MAELRGVSLGEHLRAIVKELAARKSIYGYRQRDIFTGDPDHDFSVPFHDKRPYTQLGPASGPHTQMTQNILLAFLGGARIMELKTVQILDELDIGRPCIEAPNVGFNIEWSQELKLQASFDEYVKAWILLKIIEEMELLGVPKGDPFYDCVFDISVGYDLKGISTPEVTGWLKNLMNAEEAIERELGTLPEEFAQFRTLEIDPHIANSATLSTFHGCPKDEVEAIVKYLIAELGLHVIVKCNPTQLGYTWVSQTLREEMGYSHITLDEDAFAHDMSFEDAVPLVRRLETFARDHGRCFGVKYTNTLIVNHAGSRMTNIEPGVPDKVMYLSGRPLHVISMNGMHNMRGAVGSHLHISFSAGIDKDNFVDAAACYMRPITTCTDLLNKGGYARLPLYMRNLGRAYDAVGARTMEEFLRKRAGDASLTSEEAGYANAQEIVPGLKANPRYLNAQNEAPPPSVNSHLETFDCLTCNICLPVCPNAATINIPVGKMEIETTNYVFQGGEFEPSAGNTLKLAKPGQIGILADFCNECGNCDTFCPEVGGPYEEKPNFFFSRVAYETDASWDGFYFASETELTGRIKGVEHSLSRDRDSGHYNYRSSVAELVINVDGCLVSGEAGADLKDGDRVDMLPFYTMRILMEGIAKAPDSHYKQFLMDNAGVGQ